MVMAQKIGFHASQIILDFINRFAILFLIGDQISLLFIISFVFTLTLYQMSYLITPKKKSNLLRAKGYIKAEVLFTYQKV